MKLNTTMRTAFLGAKVKTSDLPKVMPLIDMADVSLRCGSGIRRQRDWDAHLKLHTYNTLKSRGVMS